MPAPTPLTKFFSTMRNQLRTPLCSIIGYAEILIEDVEANDLAAFGADLQTIHAAAVRMLGNVDTILDVTVLELPEHHLDLEKVARTIRQELRSPLSVIFGYSDLLIEKAAAEAQKALIPDLQQIRAAVEDLINLTNSIINLSQLADEPPPAPPATAPDEHLFESIQTLPIPTSGSILIADDNLFNRVLLERFLKNQGHQVHTAETGRQALEILEQESADLLLLDINIPEMNGFEVLEFMRQHDVFQNVPVIVISALNDVELIARSIELGATDYLPLPLNRVLLQARINASMERKRLRDLEASHMQELAETVAQLQVSQKQATEANRAKSAFLTNMSHELRTPLNAVIGFSQMMARDFTLPPQHRETANIITRSGEHLLGLINDVLSISKIEAGKLTLSEAPFDLAQLVNGIAEMFRFQAEAKTLELVVELDNRLPHYVTGDEGKLRQVLINLLGNAFKFTDTGRITVRVKPLNNELCHFEIEDTGCGIPEEALEQLFEPFVQLSHRQRKPQEGTGLGLTISRSYARLMGGDITVRSRLNQGTSFSFWIPLPTLPSGEFGFQPQQTVIGMEEGQPRYRLLVVDDQDDNRALLCRLLKSAGFEVFEAVDGKRALEAWARHRPHLILMDLVMSGLDGYEAMRLIRALEAGAGVDVLPTSVEVVLSEHHEPTKIIAVSADTFGVNRARIRQCGGDDFLAKPYQFETLFEKVRDLLGVRFVRVNRVTGKPMPEPEALPMISSERLNALPPGLLRRLFEALQVGDLMEAGAVAQALEPFDGEVATELKTRFRNYDLEELTNVLETIFEN
ncbi:MAG: response regulator [Blastocatellia bacterium]|nr:response regulator [Blastocatellia bacterium]